MLNTHVWQNFKFFYCYFEQFDEPFPGILLPLQQPTASLQGDEEEQAPIFHLVPSDRIQANGLKLCQGTLRPLRGRFYTLRVTREVATAWQSSGNFSPHQPQWWKAVWDGFDQDALMQTPLTCTAACFHREPRQYLLTVHQNQGNYTLAMKGLINS